MARAKKPVHHVQMTEGKRSIIRQLLEEYDIETAEDIQDALKDLLGGTIKEMMEAEMDDHLGYERSERSDNDDYRNGYKSKTVNSSYGSMRIDVPQDRKSTFEPKVVKKRQKDISKIDQKIISMYEKGMTTRQISETIEDWQNRPLDEVYPVLYIDAIHYSVRDNGVVRKLAAYWLIFTTCCLYSTKKNATIKPVTTHNKAVFQRKMEGAEVGCRPANYKYSLWDPIVSDEDETGDRYTRRVGDTF